MEEVQDTVERKDEGGKGKKGQRTTGGGVRAAHEMRQGDEVPRRVARALASAAPPRTAHHIYHRELRATPTRTPWYKRYKKYTVTLMVHKAGSRRERGETR